ncbi:MAG: cation-transporting P-type ATPase [Bacteroidetes bacterium]|jgi:Ca2+-transporting ATPase|nr:cation-transporting P-type ATPase [Bacteroidota bacterium]
MTISYPIVQPHTVKPEVLANMLHTDLKNGLTQREAESRHIRFGPNLYEQKRPPGMFIVFLKQFKNLVVYLLFAGAIISVYFRDIPEAISILIVILINALIGFLMERQARNSMQALKRMEAITTKVLRDGFVVEVDAGKLVPGDVFYLEAGDIVPADGRLVKVQQLQCDESSLTGESQPMRKNTQVFPAETIVTEQQNMVFKGTSVVNGNGEAVITGIAKNTELGKITELVEASVDTISPLNRKLDRLTRKLIFATLVIAAVFITIQVVQGKGPLLILETAIALSVASIPEGLPIVATIALSTGMLVMARRNAIVKNLSSVETLGGTDIILTDKTGTLTENKIEIGKLTFPEEKFTLSRDAGIPVPEKSGINLEKLILTGVLCNNAHSHAHVAADPLETSLLQLGRKAGLDIEKIRAGYPRITEIPFSSETMMMISLHESPDGYFTAAKGAAEQLLKICDRIQTEQYVRNITPADHDHILRQVDDMAEEGFRVLAFAWKQDVKTDHRNFSEGLIFAGLTGFLDPPRPDIRDAIHNCRRAGIKVVMITGDHPRTALNIAHKVGLIDDLETDVIVGRQLPSGGEITTEWKKKIADTVIFARTTPQQKLDIATIYQQAGHIVAMTGDGINDAPALKKADIGIAMGLRGTQVARETSDIVLKDDSFVSIVEAIAQGRAIFRNIQKFVVYLVSCNLAEVLTITALGIIKPGAELFPLQILFLNVVTDIFPALALGLGKGDKDIMLRPPRDPSKDILYKEKWTNIIVFATMMTVAVIGAVKYCESIGYGISALNNTAFFTLTFAQLAHVFNMSDVHSHWLNNEITRNKYVWLAILLCLLITGGAYFTPGLRQVLNLAPLPWQVWLISIVAGIVPLLVVQSVKLIHFQRKKT